jgi:hypothetical protein
VSKLHVGYMDTGGISYSGAEFIAASATEEGLLAAMAEAYDKYLRNEGDENRERWLAGNADWEVVDVDELNDFGSDLAAFGELLNETYTITRATTTLEKGVRI